MIDSPERTAVHESGHAIAFHVLGLGVRRVSIISDGSCAGRTWPIADVTPDNRLLFAVGCLAGPEATRRWNPSRWDWSSGCEHDLQQVEEHLEAMVGGAARQALGQYAIRKATLSLRVKVLAERLVGHHWPEIEALADRLLKVREIDGDSAGRVFAAALETRRGDRFSL